VSLSESLVIIGLWIIPKIQKTPAECGINHHINHVNQKNHSLRQVDIFWFGCFQRNANKMISTFDLFDCDDDNNQSSHKSHQSKKS
jgi:hypothetical protein